MSSIVIIEIKCLPLLCLRHDIKGTGSNYIATQQATIKGWDSNYYPTLSRVFYLGEAMTIDKGNFCFIKDEYFIDFPDENLMKNKEVVNGISHERPCYYNFYDKDTSIKWVIPISSKIEKYEDIYNKKVAKSKNHICDTIVFGYVLGKKRAFLIQNMCPITDEYIDNVYIDNAVNSPVVINQKKQNELFQKARKVLSLYRKGFHLIFPNVLDIEKVLIEMIKQKEEAAFTDVANKNK